MATEKQIQSFIEELAPYAQKAYKSLGKVLPSVCIGMACVECAYGTAGSVKHHSYFGQKVGSGKTATRFWGGKYFTSKTKEEYTVGVHTTITSAFRAYDSMEQGVYNFYELLNSKLYDRVQAGVGFATQMQQIKMCGYMTSSTEVNSVINIINKYDLAKYDPTNVFEKTGGNPYPEPTKIVKANSRGNDARWLQVELNRYGYKLIVDGIIGPKSLAALTDFQVNHNLVPDSLCGPLTRAMLKEGGK